MGAKNGLRNFKTPHLKTRAGFCIYWWQLEQIAFYYQIFARKYLLIKFGVTLSQLTESANCGAKFKFLIFPLYF